MPRWLAVTLAVVAGLVVGYGATIASYVVLTSLGLMSDRDGGVAMGFAFSIGPVVAVMIAIFAGLWAARRTTTF